jgi:hypothetical protein
VFGLAHLTLAQPTRGCHEGFTEGWSTADHELLVHLALQ